MVKISFEEITESYAVPIANDLELMSLQDYNSLANSAEKIENLILKHPVPLIRPLNNKKNSKKVFFRLPDDVKLARSHGTVAFDLWKESNFSLESEIHEIYRTTRKEYRQKLHNFLNQTEEERIKKLCISVESNEKLFWKLIKSQRSSSQMSAFLVHGNLLTDKSAIRDMWADHFEAFGAPSENSNFDNDFFSRVTCSVHGTLESYSNDPSGILC